MSKFLESIEKYRKAMGLTEAVPGTTGVTDMPSAKPAVPGKDNIEELSVDDIANLEKGHVKTTEDITSRIKLGTATEADYTALAAASMDLEKIQAAKAKLNAASKPANTPAAANTVKPAGTNSLNKPLV
jgi:hypothetical protein